MARQSKEQKDTVQRVMHEFKHGELETSHGRTVGNPKQAIAIALHEAGATNQESPAKNRENLRRTKARERRGETPGETSGGTPADTPTRTDLYDQAKKRRIPGRSKMNKQELERALRR